MAYRSEPRLATIGKEPSVAAIRLALGADANLYLVGGTVRDVLFGIAAKDLDLATPLQPAEVMHRLHAAGIHTIPTGLQHGTVLAVIDGNHIEITTLRRVQTDGSVGFGSSIEDDLAARDFTVNAMAYQLDSDRLIDPAAGASDLKANILRAVGDAHARLSEDPLRLLRCIRFGPATGRTVEKQTAAVAGTLAATLSTVSPERVRKELMQILQSSHVADGLRALYSYGFMAVILPELCAAVGFEQNSFHDLDVFEHTLRVIENTPADDALLRLTALFHDVGKPATLSVDDNGQRHFYRHEELSTEMCQAAMKRLRFSNDEIESVSLIVRHHMRPVDCGAPGVRRIMRDLGEHFESWLSFKQADAHGCKGHNPQFDADVRRFEEMVTTERARSSGPSYGKLALNGDDLQSLGMAPGPGMGAILRQLEEFVIEEPTRNTKEQLLAEVARLRA